MRTFLNRSRIVATTSNAKKDEEKPLNSKQTVQTTLRETRALRAANVASNKTNAASSNRSSTSSIPISDITGSRGLVSQNSNLTSNNNAMKNTSGTKVTHIPISDITGSRGLVSQGKNPASDGNSPQSTTRNKDPYIPISVVTGSRDITTVSPQLRAFLQKGSLSATTAMPNEYADLANLLEKTGSEINFDGWSDMTARQQLSAAQKSGLSKEDQWALLNATPHYVETIAKVQELFANRYALGITVADARNAAKELFDIADERNEAITKTGKYENDAVFAPRALRWLDEQEEKLLDNLTKNASETDTDTEYTGGNPDLAARAARRATYADIDQAVASEQIEELIMKNVEEAKKHTPPAGQDKSNLWQKVALWLSFYNRVSENAPMDYKNQIIWQEALHGLPYPEEDQVYNVFGIDISSSDLGNLNYAMVGKALGISDTDLLQQAGAAQLRKDYKLDIFKSEVESSKKRDEGYGDQRDDQGMILNGFNIYNLLD